VPNLASDDFESLRATLGQARNPVSLKVEMQRVRSIFKHAYDAGLVDRPVRFGPTFKSPSRRVIQKNRQSKRRMFEDHEIRQMINASSPQLRAMILLGINCGYGNSDCANLPKSALDLDAGWVVFPRPKTGVERRCPLWPQTMAAVKAAIAVRPAPKDPEDDGMVFLTARGLRWVRIRDGVAIDSIVTAANRLLTKLGLKQHGLGFYGLRHSHRTAGGKPDHGAHR
jgi:integrase